MDLDKILDGVRQISHRVAEFQREQAEKISARDIEIKGSHDYVTYVDKTSEKMLVESLQKLVPEAGFIAEEGTVKEEGERYNWIVDPLDGTTNFIHGIPFHCISIALQDKACKESPCKCGIGGAAAAPIPEGEIVLGLVHHVNMNRQYYAVWGKQAMEDEKPIHVSPLTELDNALIVTGFPYYDFSQLNGYMEFLKETMQTTAGVRRLGSAALDLALVAAGHGEVFYEYSLKPWDVAAGQFIVKQAGGLVCDFAGGPDYLHGQELVCGNEAILEKFLPRLQKYVKSKF